MEPMAVAAPLAVYSVTAPRAFARVGDRDVPWSRTAGVITLEPAVAGRLVVAEAWAPGWRSDRPVRNVDGQMSLEVDAGEHVVLRYQPAGWVWGRRIWVLGMVLMVLMVLMAGRRARS